MGPPSRSSRRPASSRAAAWRNFAIVILVVLCAAAFFLGRLEGKTEVRWQRGDGKKGADGVTKSPARLVRVEKKTR